MNYQQKKSLNESNVSVSFREWAARLWDPGFPTLIFFSWLTEGSVGGTRGLSEVNAHVSRLLRLYPLIIGFSFDTGCHLAPTEVRGKMPFEFSCCWIRLWV